MTIRFRAMETTTARAFRAGAADANGQAPERTISDGNGNPCRHCLRDIPAGDGMLVLAYRPFPTLQPYAEVGPIFLCAADCARHPDGADLPPILASRPAHLVKGYGADDRIVYGSGRITQTDALADDARALLDRPEIAYLHVRSAGNNCFFVRVERDPGLTPPRSGCG